MTSRRSALVVGLGLALAVLAVLPALAEPPAAAPGGPPTLPAFLLSDSACASPTVTPGSATDPNRTLEVEPWSTAQPLCTHPPCPTGWLYDCFCMECHPHCGSGFFWESDLCSCQAV
ncbi:MAG TPA: hypothetical protein VFE33_17740 [Thermoanaerobaculia bacterium]|nr:hypothetical protein [Thermoanaerobaculia bacterium]